MCPSTVDKTNWLGSSTASDVFSISISDFVLTVTRGTAWTLDLTIVCDGPETDTLIKTASTVSYNDTVEGYNLHVTDEYESCNLDSIDECEIYGGFNPNWFCVNMPIRNQESCFDMAHYDEQNKAWMSVGSSEYIGRGIGSIGISHDAKDSHGNSRRISYVEGSAATEFNFSEILSTDYTICTVSRYTGDSRGRIFTGSTGDWLHMDTGMVMLALSTMIIVCALHQMEAISHQPQQMKIG